MKIALISPIEETVPPTKYGGTEWIVYHLAHFLSLKGHHVDLYASADSKQELYNLIPVADEHIRSHKLYLEDPKMRDSIKLLKFSDTIKQLQNKNYDIIHNHISWRFFIFAPFIEKKVLTTHHGPLSINYQQLFFDKYKDYFHISISNNQRKDLPDLNYVSTIYNGIRLQDFTFKADIKNDAPMVFLARLSPEKGAYEAAKVAHLTKKKTIFAAKVDMVNEEYYEKFLSLIDKNYVEFHGEIGQKQRDRYLHSARCLIVPIQWEEPFGLMFTEAMACGTPVITFARGSAPEIIKDGETGYLVNYSEKMRRGDWVVKKTGIDGLCEAVERIYSLPDKEYEAMRTACRERVTKYFTAEKMVGNYEKAYKKILSMV